MFTLKMIWEKATRLAALLAVLFIQKDGPGATGNKERGNDKMKTQHTNNLKESGFTLIELFMVLALSGVIMSSIYSVYISQQRAYIMQQENVSMQQNIRGAMYFMEREIKMAGYDQTESGIDGVRTADRALFEFEMDIHDGKDNDGDGKTDEDDEMGHPDGSTDDKGERIKYGFNSADDSDGNGIADSGIGALRRDANDGSGFQVIAEGIHAIGFAYAYDNDGDKALDTYVDTDGNDAVYWAIDSDGDGELDINLDTNDDGEITAADDEDGNGLIDELFVVPPVAKDKIRAVKIWILARSKRPFPEYTNVETYVVGDKVITTSGAASHYTHRLLTTAIVGRNLGVGTSY
jgi:type IV pilus assembly protein PilW